MTAIWFGLAAITLAGAIVLLYFDRRQRQRTGHARQVWAKAQGYTYVSVEPALASTWRRGALAKLGYLTAVDVVTGIRKGEKFVLLDLEDSATLVAVRRQIGSDIDVDMRLKTMNPPKDADLELLGAIGDRVVFATNPEIARHAVDQRMVAFIESLADTVQMLWSEGNWTLGMLPVGTAAKDWETGIDAVLRLSGLLHVLPPVTEPRPEEQEGPARSRPRGRPADYDEDDADRDYDEDPDEPYGRPGPHVRYRQGDPEDRGEPDDRASGPGDGTPPRRPSLAVVPDTRVGNRTGRPEPVGSRPGAAERPGGVPPRRDASDDENSSRPPGGPFHPGFRPYQGPVPQ